MTTTFKYTWGAAVRVRPNAPVMARPGQPASVCGMRELNAERLDLVEFADGQAIEIAENLLERVEQD